MSKAHVSVSASFYLARIIFHRKNKTRENVILIKYIRGRLTRTVIRIVRIPIFTYSAVSRHLDVMVCIKCNFAKFHYLL